MILRATGPESVDERELRVWLANTLGNEDERTLSAWVWENHHGSSVRYVDALAAIVRQTGEQGLTFVRNLLDFAKKPKAEREAEQELLAWASVHVRLAVAKVRQHGGDRDVANAEFTLLCERLQEKLRNMYPDKHRATMRGAMMSAFRHENGKFELNVARLVKTLHMSDPLATNAAASWG